MRDTKLTNEEGNALMGELAQMVHDHLWEKLLGRDVEMASISAVLASMSATVLGSMMKHLCQQEGQTPGEFGRQLHNIYMTHAINQGEAMQQSLPQYVNAYVEEGTRQ